MLHLATIAVSVAISVPPVFDIERLLTSPTRHVRALTPDTASLLAQGVRRSRTFAQLVARLERSDVIVQILPSSTLKPSVAGRLLLVPGRKVQRFVRIEIRMEGTTADLVSVLAHELRHAVEIADAPDVQDSDSLERLYRRIGHGGPSVDGFDTDAAIRAGRQVRAEIEG